MKRQPTSHSKARSESHLFDGNPGLWSVVAFQDEITRSLNLADPAPLSLNKPKKSIPKTLPPINTRLPTGPATLSSSHLDTLAHAHRTNAYNTYPNTHGHPPPTHTHMYTPTNRASVRHSPPPLAPVFVRSPPSVTPVSPFTRTANGKTALKGIAKEKEEIVALDQHKYNLTLAQKMGLTPSPPPPLTYSQWEEVKKMSDSRHDSHMPCAICKDEFRAEGQILLSCSHVFHKICLDSFEKYSKTKSCPLCRREEYQKAQITEGKAVYLNKCASKIQATYRGYRARKLFRQIMDSHPPEDTAKRKVFFARKLEKLTDQLLRKIEQDRAMIDSSITAMNHNVAASIAYLRSVPIGSMLNPGSINWKEAHFQARTRNVPDCPICIMPLGRLKNLTLLSCSHVFHESCIDSFEHFNCETLHLCPVCRTMYHKTMYNSHSVP